MGALWGMRVVCEAKAESWAQIPVQTSLHGVKKGEIFFYIGEIFFSMGWLGFN